MKHILIITADGRSIIRFRLALIQNLLAQGYKVSVVVPKNTFSYILQREMNDLGAEVVFFKLSRTGLNIFKEFFSLLELYKVIKNYKPNIIISYLIKPVIYTGLILRFFKRIRYFPLITGVGYGLYEKNSTKHKILKSFIIKLYKEAIKSSERIIFQNQDDKALFYELKIIKNNKKSAIVNGSGVNMSLYPFSKLPQKPVFLMISRLIKDKGVREYVQAAKIVKSTFPDVVFQLAGSLDENPESISQEELQSWIDRGDIKYLGEIKSVQSILKNCKFFVLPSYREGTPRSTLEALSTGRPIITTDVPGCRETVIHKKNGLLVQSRDYKLLADAMMKLLKENDKNITKMANESYLIAKNKFEVDKVNKTMLDIMKL